MGGEICYQPTRERGPWYEIQCIKNDAIYKLSIGEEPAHEMRLLKSWAKYPGYHSAQKALIELRTRKKSTHSPQKGKVIV